MKRLLLVISVITISLLLSSFNFVSIIGKEDEMVEQICANPKINAVRIVNEYNVFLGNGFVYKNDDKYSYIVSSYDVIDNVKTFSVILSNGINSLASLVGKDDKNNISVIKINKSEKFSDICLANSNVLYRGQRNYLYGYINNKESFVDITYLSSIGDLYYSKDYYNVYKSVIETNWFKGINGTGVFDEYNRLIGVINGREEGMIGCSFITNSNKLRKIVDNIVKNGNYKQNRLKYTLVDYGSLSSILKESYGVSDKVSSGVVITTFKPFNYIFGGLNQGMTIVAVNGVVVDNCYEFDNQITRYENGSTICLKVIKTNGKEMLYFVKV